MKTAFCKCGNRLFFNNHSCLACGRSVGRCNACRKLTSFTSNPAVAQAGVESSTTDEDVVGTYQCDQPGCIAELVPCANRHQAACTSFVSSELGGLCEWCQFTTLIPDLDDPLNVIRWGALETAKRRLLAELEQLGLPPYIGNLRTAYPLTFQFAAPTLINGIGQPVITGHAEGVITINAEEADSDRREATRVALGEPQRTLIGHMRHEIGHYIDWAYAWQVARKPFVELFGDPMALNYEQAKQRHYSRGAPVDWPARFVSAYASMHPWEDFAETVNAYLDLMAIAETARDQKLGDIDISPAAEVTRIIQQTLPMAVAISEFNTDLGLPALLPEQLSPTAVTKLSFVHSLRHPDTKARLKQLAPEIAGEPLVGGTTNLPKVTPPKPSNLAPAPKPPLAVDQS